MCRFAAPLAFNFMAAIALPPSPDHRATDVTNTVSMPELPLHLLGPLHD